MSLIPISGAFGKTGLRTPDQILSTRILEWFKPESLSGSDGTDITTWSDSSGNGRNATEATNPPKIYNDVLNGYAVARFDGTNDVLRTAVHATTTQPVTVFVVARRTAITEPVVSYLFDGPSSANRQMATIEFIAAGDRYSIFAGSQVYTDRPTAVRGWGVYAATYNGASSMFRNNSAALASSMNAGTNGHAGLTLGARFGGTDFLAGDIAEVIAAEDVTDDERREVEDYLYGKFGLHPQYVGTNAASPLSFDTTPVVDANDEITHPSIVDAGPSGWNGYRYWLAATPYPSGSAAFENPHLYASNDGQSWVIPPGVTNPLEPQPAGGHNSDTELVLHDGTLYLYWRAVETEGVDEPFYMISSTDSTTWTTKVEVLQGVSTGRRLVSPAVIYDGAQWVMWAVDIDPSTPGVMVRMTASAPEGPWSSPADTTLVEPATNIWHVAVRYQSGRYFCFYSAPAGGAKIYCASSLDGINWNQQSLPVLSPTGDTADWDGVGLYRPTFLSISGTQTWGMWYGSSRDATNGLWKIGYTTVSAVS